MKSFNMENKRVLFITFDMSGYYDGVRKELERRYASVEYFNMAAMPYRYKNFGSKIQAFVYKLFTGKKLKNFWKYQSMVEPIRKQRFDLTLMVRPDLLFDSQLQAIKNSSGRMIAYYHDSINNIPRKKNVIHFFDEVWSYEKKDVQDYKLSFSPNFIYFEPEVHHKRCKTDAFSVMSYDYRVETLRQIAEDLTAKQLSHEFFVAADSPRQDTLVTYITARMNNEQVLDHIRKAKAIVDVHKYGIQDGLTFRTFEALGMQKKLITTNADVASYDFFDPQNIFIVKPGKAVEIPSDFFDTPYNPVPADVLSRYTIGAFLDRLLHFSR